MPYQITVSLRRDSAAVLEAARLVLIGENFSVEEPRAGVLVARAPWLFNSRQPALRGISRLEIEFKGSTMTVTASRRNALALALFVLLFPPALLLVVSAIEKDLSAIGRVVTVWGVVGPAMAVWIWYRTRWALQRFVSNLQRMGESPR
jgi:hypothetical protein